MKWPRRLSAANAMDVAADDRHNFSWCACSHLLPVLRRDKIAAPALTLSMDASHASIEVIGERGFEANWPWPPLEPLRCGKKATQLSHVFDSFLKAAHEALYLVTC